MDLLMRRAPVPYEKKRVKMMGMNNDTEFVVSNMITASEYVILVDPDSTAVAPRMANIPALTPSEPSV